MTRHVLKQSNILVRRSLQAKADVRIGGIRCSKLAYANLQLPILPKYIIVVNTFV